MKIVILGYGKMGEQVEIAAKTLHHQIAAYIDSEEDWNKNAAIIPTADVAIEFSTPQTVLNNIDKCLQLHLPIVVGTTGWYDQLDNVRQKCEQMQGSVLYASNFSLGVNLFFALNSALAHIMNGYNYDISIEEIHHINKKDAPSGTAITLANDIISVIDNKKTWINEMNDNPQELSIKSQRLSNNVGTHIVTYQSDMDAIEIKHTAFNRKGFAMGAVKGAEWLLQHQGFHSIKDMFNFNQPTI